MPNDLHVHPIEAALLELYSGLDQGESLVATIEGAQGGAWVQVLDELINLSWPFDQEAAYDLEEQLAERLPHCQLHDIQVGTYATFEIVRPTATELAQVIGWIFERVYGIGQEQPLSTSVESI